MRITKNKLKQIIAEEIKNEAARAGGVAVGGETGGWARDPSSGFEEEEEIIGDEPVESARDLSDSINDVILHLRAMEKRDPTVGALANELIKVQQELDRQANERTAEEQ